MAKLSDETLVFYVEASASAKALLADYKSILLKALQDECAKFIAKKFGELVGLKAFAKQFDAAVTREEICNLFAKGCDPGSQVKQNEHWRSLS